MCEMILTDENHPYGCEYEPAVVMIRQRVGNRSSYIVPMHGERCKWCGEEFVSAKLLNELDEDLAQSLGTASRDPDADAQSWTFCTPTIHPVDDSVSTAVDDIGETRNSIITRSSNYITAATTTESQSI